MRKGKVAILTLLYKNYNYGGVLQAYALNHILEGMGYNVEVVKYDRNNSKIFCFARVKNKCLKLIHYRIENNRYSFFFHSVVKEKKKKFDAFVEKYINQSKYVYSQINENDIQQYDIYICGSDQVWSPVSGRPAMFLSFVPSVKKKIAYAASIGADKISDEYEKKIQPLIERIDYISVREEGAYRIINKMLPNKPCTVVLDPTLLLQVDDWKKMEFKVAISDNEPFVLIYMIGENDETWIAAYKCALTLNCRIINIPFNKMLYTKHDEDHKDISLSDVGPGEFLWLIEHASYVLTDSFHGMVFSLLFHKKYRLYTRPVENENGSMNGRLNSLLNLLHAPVDNLFNVADFNVIDKKIQSEREKSIDFLKKALED